MTIQSELDELLRLSGMATGNDVPTQARVDALTASLQFIRTHGEAIKAALEERDTAGALRHAANVIDLWDAAVADNDYMADSNDCSAIVRILADHAPRPVNGVVVPVELLTYLRDEAYANAQEYHHSMKGYRQARHDAMDARVAEVDALLSAAGSEP